MWTAQKEVVSKMPEKVRYPRSLLYWKHSSAQIRSLLLLPSYFLVQHIMIQFPLKNSGLGAFAMYSIPAEASYFTVTLLSVVLLVRVGFFGIGTGIAGARRSCQPFLPSRGLPRCVRVRLKVRGRGPFPLFQSDCSSVLERLQSAKL